MLIQSHLCWTHARHLFYAAYGFKLPVTVLCSLFTGVAEVMHSYRSTASTFSPSAQGLHNNDFAALHSFAD